MSLTHAPAEVGTTGLRSRTFTSSHCESQITRVDLAVRLNHLVEGQDAACVVKKYC